MLGFLTAVLAADTGSGSSGIAVLVPLLLMGLVFYFLLIRPQQRQRRQHRDLVDAVDVGDEVVTIGGAYGTVRAMDDEALTLEVAPGVNIRFSRGAIARRLVYDEDDYADESADHEEEEAGDQS